MFLFGGEMVILLMIAYHLAYTRSFVGKTGELEIRKAIYFREFPKPLC